jgi:putative heme-binding domain-containing protein
MRAPIVVPGLAVIAATLMPPPALPADDPVSLRRHALEQPGDPERGRQLFQSLQPLACSSCHRVGADGGDAGPDLSAIGNKSDRPHLIESLLDPSRQIVEGYRTTMIAMRNGRVLSGVVRDETDDSLRLVDALAATTTIRKPEIAERKLSELSLMPDDLVSGLDAQSFTDLVADARRGRRRPVFPAAWLPRQAHRRGTERRHRA